MPFLSKVCYSGRVAQWIRHQTSDLGIAGSNPVTVEIFFLILKYDASFWDLWFLYFHLPKFTKNIFKLFVGLSQEILVNSTSKYWGSALKMTSFGSKDDVWGATIIKAMKYMFANDKKVSHFSQEGGVDYPKFGGFVKPRIFVTTTTTILQGHSFIRWAPIFHYFWWAPFLQSPQSRSANCFIIGLIIWPRTISQCFLKTVQ